MSVCSVNRLPASPPPDPLPLVARWIEDAVALGSRRNPTAMALATVSQGGQPSVRIVLLKSLSTEQGYCVFYTNYGSRKAHELDATGRAAATLHWDSLGRQLRFEGRVVRAPAAESDAYFRLRPWRSQLNAWTSEQSQPIAAPALLEQRAREQGPSARPARARSFICRRRGQHASPRVLGRLPALVRSLGTVARGQRPVSRAPALRAPARSRRQRRLRSECMEALLVAALILRTRCY